jgi:hypothetical protein
VTPNQQIPVITLRPSISWQRGQSARHHYAGGQWHRLLKNDTKPSTINGNAIPTNM